ncbi:MAG: hypothetical protein HKN16_13700 [Saprospiraceae bacterium]|nr:hypothetical protein [Saprospiraceae bacterium]
MKTQLYIVCSFFILLIFCPELRGQEVYSMDDLLFSRSENTNALDPAIGLNEKINLKPVGLLEKLEFRTNSDEWDLERQQYTLRLSPNDFKSPKTIRAIQDLQLRSLEFIGSGREDEILFSRYQIISDYYFAVEELKIREKENTLLADEKTVLEYKAESEADVDIDGLLDNRLEKEKNDIRIESLKRKQALAISTLRGTEEASGVLDVSNLITIEKIRRRVTSWADGIIQGYDLDRQSLEIEERMLEVQKEKEVGRKIIDFVQLRYRGDNDLNIGREISFGVGLNIPVPSSNSRRKNEALIDLEQEKMQHQQIKQEQQKEVLSILAELEESFFEFDSYNAILSKDLFSNSLKAMQVDGPGDIKASLSIQLAENRLKKEILDLQEDILNGYLDLAFKKGLIYQRPKFNFIDNSLAY